MWGGRLLCSYDINTGSYWTETVEEGTDSNIILVFLLLSKELTSKKSFGHVIQE